MKNRNTATTLTLALACGLLGAHMAQASTWIETTKGPRLSTAWEQSGKGNRLTTSQDFRDLREGDRVSHYCPMMNKTFVTTIRDVDSKGHVKIKETKEGLSMKGCNLVLERNSGSKNVNPMMRCPDGTLRPVECRKMAS